MSEQKEGIAGSSGGFSSTSTSADTASASLAVPIADHTRESSAVFFHLSDGAPRGSTTGPATSSSEAKTVPSSDDKALPEATSTTSGVEMQNLSSPTASYSALSPREGIAAASSLSSLTEKQPANCVERREGFNRGQVWASFCFCQGIILWILPLIIPGVVMILMQQQICDRLCIPIPAAGSLWVQNLTNPDDWKINNFLTNSNRSWWPQEYFNVYLYHINNSDAVLAGKESKLKVDVVGPYVFSTYRYKYNTSFSPDFEQISYNQAVQYTFHANMSGGRLLTDMLTTVNMPLASINWMEWTVAGMPMNLATDEYCSLHFDTTGNSCLFQKKLTVQQILFGQASQIYQVANAVFGGFLAPTFQLFFNYSTSPAVANSQHLVNSFGMGGKVHPYIGKLFSFSTPTKATVLPFNFTYGRPTVNDSLLSTQYTGQGSSYSNLYGFSQYEGNSSLTVWNGDEPIRGTDHFQFAPPVTPYSTLTVWDDDVMRTVDLQFLEKVNVIGMYDAYRFSPTDDLFSGTDPHYGGQPGFEGLLSVSPVSQVHYGAVVSAYASRPFLAGVNSTLANSVICMNCPDMTDPADWLNIYVDVEPNTGKVLGGSKRGQINALLGQPFIYHNLSYSSTYQNLSLSLVPVVYFEYTQEVEVGPQTDQLDDGMDQIKLARVATSTIFYLLLPLSVIAFMASFIIAIKADEAGACCHARGADTAGMPYTAK